MVQTLRRSGLNEEESRKTLLSLGRYAIGWAAQEMQAGGRRDDDGFEFGLNMFMAGLRQTVRDRRLTAKSRART
jgi:hypothetical protein